MVESMLETEVAQAGLVGGLVGLEDVRRCSQL
jgi:hypothetical protein